MADRYIDFSNSTGTLTGTWTFTNASATVNSGVANGNALAEVAVGDYIRQSDGIQWYKVTAVPDDDNITITPTFQQATHTDDIGASLLNSEDGSAADGNAFCHHNQATTDEGRVAGDIIRTRGGLTYTYAGVDITCDDDGTVHSYIEIRGIYTAAGDNNWGDGNTTRPVIDFGNTAYQLAINTDEYWKVTGVDLTGSNDPLGALLVSGCDRARVEDCRFYDNGNASTRVGLQVRDSPGIEITDCVFDNNFGYSLRAQSCHVILSGCTFNGDGDNPIGSSGNSTDVGIVVVGGTVHIKDTVFGTDTNGDHDVADIGVFFGGQVYCRNTKLDSATEVIHFDDGGFVMLEDDEQTHLAFKGSFFNGTIERSAVVERSGAGGTAWSILMEPGANCGAEHPLYGIGDWLRGIPIYLDGTEQTITMYCYAFSWAGLPTVAQFVVEVEHYEGAADWEIDTTSDTFAANDQWESFAITLTPGAAGPAYLRVYLKDYEDGSEKIYIDPKPVIS